MTEKKELTFEEIQAEEKIICENLGRAEYQSEVLKAQKAAYCRRLLELNNQAHKLQNPAPPEETPTPPTLQEVK